MKLSYAITVCNELVEIQRLLPYLIENKRKESENKKIQNPKKYTFLIIIKSTQNQLLFEPNPYL